MSGELFLQVIPQYPFSSYICACFDTAMSSSGLILQKCSFKMPKMGTQAVAIVIAKDNIR
jgi:hypothetical protein